MRNSLKMLLMFVLLFGVLPLTSSAEPVDAKMFVQQVMAPTASQSSDIRFSQQELNALKASAADHGIVIPGSLLPLFNQPDAAYKEEFMRAMLKEQLGFYRDTWSIADQAWYDNLLIDAGLRSKPRAVLPQSGDISQEDALNLAVHTVQERWAEAGELLNSSIWRLHTTYTFIEPDTGDDYRQFVFWFEPLAVDHAMYHITIHHDGSILDALTEPGTQALGITPGQVQDRYSLTYGAMNTWSYETWLNFQRDLQRAIDQSPPGEVRGNIRLFLEQEYAKPTADMLTKSQAINIASALPEAPKALNQQYTGAVLLMDKDIPVWKVQLIPLVDPSISRAMPFLVEVNAMDGAVRNFRQTEPETYQYRLDYVLERLAPKQ